ncbi:receptor-interacting serine/threonine-protein kinase 4 [Platysternon megacephalum]|uniref:Receptor-interacting serine/threonine-protein kinase 4 n=1 Tax=Platysternon megacephalum TaxID=55544 RepID=A0A4D9E5K0_9SAUR|nr:receptor-interacting serine/threonine-protein kinase 4 [Platysternon megacephalum]
MFTELLSFSEGIHYANWKAFLEQEECFLSPSLAVSSVWGLTGEWRGQEVLLLQILVSKWRPFDPSPRGSCMPPPPPGVHPLHPAARQLVKKPQYIVNKIVTEQPLLLLSIPVPRVASWLY